MKIFAVTLILIAFCSITKADQLAYLSKTDADRGAKVIKETQSLVLYCACCSNYSVQKVEITNVTVKYTGYEEYYEIIIEYIDDKGNEQSEAIDLAYVWTMQNGKYVTIGQILELEHDPCSDGEFEIE